MSTCYKFGRELAGGNECEPDCSGVPPVTDEQVVRFLAMIRRQQLAIDWDKVTTLEDLLLVIKTIFGEARVMKGSEAAEKLKHFLKSIPDGQP